MKTIPKVIKILGVGSSRDRFLFESVEMAADELGLPVDIIFVSDIDAFIKMGITAIPAMMIGDEIVANGRVPAITEIKHLLQRKEIREARP